MRTMKWPAVVGLAVAAALAGGCRGGPPKSMPTRGVVQVQRHDEIRGTRTVAYMTEVPGTPSTQVWLSTEPPAGLRPADDGSVVFVLDSDHFCPDAPAFHEHMESVHMGWIAEQRVRPDYYTTPAPAK